MSLVLTQRNKVAPGGRGQIRRGDWVRRCVLQWFLFAVFGLVGAAFGGAMHLARLFGRPGRTLPTRRWIQVLLLRFSRLLQLTGVIKIDCSLVSPPPGTLIITNHPSLLDAPLLLGRLPGVAPIVKRSLLRNPFLAPAIYAADYVTNDDGYQMVEECVRRLRAGESVLVFPEGTRTPADGIVRLRRGAAQIAVRARCPILPITIRVSVPFLRKVDSYWRAPAEQPAFWITALPVIEARGEIEIGNSEAIAARRLTQHLQHLYDEELELRGPA